MINSFISLSLFCAFKGNFYKYYCGVLNRPHKLSNSDWSFFLIFCILTRSFFFKLFLSCRREETSWRRKWEASDCKKTEDRGGCSKTKKGSKAAEEEGKQFWWFFIWFWRWGIAHVYSWFHALVGLTFMWLLSFLTIFYCYLVQKPAVKPAALSKKIPTKNGAVKAPAKKGKPVSSSSESSEDDSSESEDEVLCITIYCWISKGIWTSCRHNRNLLFQLLYPFILLHSETCAKSCCAFKKGSC